jgi:hypothetical protein
MAPVKRDYGSSSGKSAYGGTSLPVTHTVASMQTCMPVPGSYN